MMAETSGLSVVLTDSDGYWSLQGDHCVVLRHSCMLSSANMVVGRVRVPGGACSSMIFN